MLRQEIKELLEVINDNLEGEVVTPQHWIPVQVEAILNQSVISNIDIYGRGEIGDLQEDINSFGTEVKIDVDNKFTSLRSVQIELYSSESQYIDFEIDNVVTLTNEGSDIFMIEDLKEDDQIIFNHDEPLILVKIEYVYTSEQGLKVDKSLIIYTPLTLSDVEEGVDY